MKIELDAEWLKCCGNCFYAENGCVENSDYDDNFPVDCGRSDVSHSFRDVCPYWEWDKEMYRNRCGII